MKIVLLAVFLLFLLMTGSTSVVRAQGVCGFLPPKPLNPLGCKDTRPVCICDSENQHCQWQWACIK